MEWTVVTVAAVLLGLIASVVRPLIALNTTITRLTASVDALEKNLAAQNDETRRRIGDHEDRLRAMEQRAQ